MPYNFAMESLDGSNKPIFTTASETLATATTESYASESQSTAGGLGGLFSPLAPSFRLRETSELMGLMHQEPKPVGYRCFERCGLPIATSACKP